MHEEGVIYRDELPGARWPAGAMFYTGPGVQHAGNQGLSGRARRTRMMATRGGSGDGQGWRLRDRRSVKVGPRPVVVAQHRLTLGPAAVAHAVRSGLAHGTAAAAAPARAVAGAGAQVPAGAEAVEAVRPAAVVRAAALGIGLLVERAVAEGLEGQDPRADVSAVVGGDEVGEAGEAEVGAGDGDQALKRLGRRRGFPEARGRLHRQTFVAGVALPPPAPFGGVRAGGVRPGRPGMAAWIGDGGCCRVPRGVIVAQEGVGDSSTANDNTGKRASASRREKSKNW